MDRMAETVRVAVQIGVDPERVEVRPYFLPWAPLGYASIAAVRVQGLTWEEHGAIMRRAAESCGRRWPPFVLDEPEDQRG